VLSAALWLGLGSPRTLWAGTRAAPVAAADVAALIHTLADADPYRRGAAAVALGDIGVAAVPALTQSLADARPEVRLSAAITLGRIGPPARPALPALLRALADPSARLRQAAAVAVGELGAAPVGDTLAAAVPAALTDLLSDADEAVRHAATQALQQAAPGARAQPPTLEALLATLDRLVPALMAELHVPGVAVALIHKRQPSASRAYGVRSEVSREPVDAYTVFEAASMSKPVLALLAMQLVDQQRLALDRPLLDYGAERLVPDLADKRLVTARMALSHTSGYPNWRPGGEEVEGPLPLLFKPGARFAYSGEGIFYLQRRMEHITGLPLDPMAAQMLFGPLGLAHTGFGWTPALGRQQASGHKDDGTLLTTSKYLHPNAAYSLYTTAGDYARLLAELMRAEQGASTLLSQQAAREMLRPQVPVGSREPIQRPGAALGLAVSWGLGWSLNHTAAGDIAHHSGANSTGFRSFSQFSPTRGSGIVILTNGTQGDALWTRLMAAIGDL